jgi:hypothetical protein
MQERYHNYVLRMLKEERDELQRNELATNRHSVVGNDIDLEWQESRQTVKEYFQKI